MSSEGKSEWIHKKSRMQSHFIVMKWLPEIKAKHNKGVAYTVFCEKKNISGVQYS